MNILSYLAVFLFLFYNIRADLNTSWWKSTIIYEVFIWSFKDSDGDGIGDIKGVTSMLDHFVNLNVETLYLSPFFKSPMGDMGYDVADYMEIDSRFGTMEDFQELMIEMRKRGLKLVIDLVINHSSDKHPWFEKSVKGISPYTNYYIWKEEKGSSYSNSKKTPPNNWMSMFGGSAWEYNETRSKFYLHQFSKHQPDLNLRNENVKQEIKSIIKFWLDQGVSGIRLDATRHYMEDETFKDEPILSNDCPITDYCHLNHIYTVDLQASYDFLNEIRTFVENYDWREQGFEKILIAEAYTDMQHTMDYYGTKDRHIMHFPFNFLFVTLKSYQSANAFNEFIHIWLDNMPDGATPNWMAENHDNNRVGSRFCEEYMDIIVTTIMMLPGIACVYYGQEIGMVNNHIRDDQRRDPNYDVNTGITRDSERLPMQWDNSTNAGFTSNHKAWLPPHPNYWKVNVNSEMLENISHYNMFRQLSFARKAKSVKLGAFEPYVISEYIYAFVRSYQNYEKYLVVLNLGTEMEIVSLHQYIKDLPLVLEVATASVNAGYKKGDKIRGIPKFPRLFIMNPLSSVVLRTKSHGTEDELSEIEKQDEEDLIREAEEPPKMLNLKN